MLNFPEDCTSFIQQNILSEHGIHPLTGEADGTSLYRMLCDVTEEGKGWINKYLGGTIEVREGSNWNSNQPAGKSIGSVMLTYSSMRDIAILITIMSGKGVLFSYDKEQSREHPRYITIFPSQKSMSEFIANESNKEDNQFNFHPYYTFGTAGDRNIHQMSGRIS